MDGGGIAHDALSDDIFVGREGYLRSLLQAFEETRRGRPAVVLLHAKSGSGKIVLPESFLRQIAHLDSALVFRSRCYEQESVPFKAIDGVVDALSSFLCRIPQANAVELLPPGFLRWRECFRC